MPKFLVVGVVASKGTFVNDQGKSYDYDNLNLHVTNPIEQGKGFGQFTNIIKAKLSLFPSEVQSKPSALLNKNIKVSFDQNKKIEDIDILA